MTPELEEVLGLIYKGQTNLAVKAKELNLPIPKLKQLLNNYISMNPITDDAWNADIELGWPYIT